MATRISTAARNAACDALVDLVDGGSGAGLVRIYTGSQPAGPGSSATGTLLVEITVNDPAFGPASNGAATLDVDPVPTGTGVADGTAGWFRLLDSAGVAILDGSVTAAGGGGELELATTTISTGLTVTVSAGTVTMPSA